MEFRGIEYFLTVAKTLNFRQAAEKLYISPQALSKQIMQLEKEVGTLLMERSSSGVRLTESGELFVHLFTPVLKKYKEAQKELDSHINLQKENVHIGFFQGLPQEEVVYNIIRFLMGTQPKINIDLISSGLDEIKDLLEEGVIDMAITNIYKEELWDNVETITLGTLPAQIIISLYNPWIVKDEITEADLRNGKLLCLRPESKMPETSFYRTIDCKEKIYTKDFDSLLTLLSTGDYFAVFPPIFSHAHSGKFDHYPLPESYSFDFHTVCAFKKQHPLRKIFGTVTQIDKIW